MLHDKYLPEFHFSERHEIVINAGRDAVFQLADQFDFRDSFIIRLLLKLRGISGGQTIKGGLLQGKFIELEIVHSQEMIFGLIGQFWKPAGNLLSIPPAGFITFFKPEYLKATWNFNLLPVSDQITLLSTETRIQCMDQTAYKKFSLYWTFIKPFSGLIRKEMLRSIKRKAESAYSQLQPSS
jgi:hypothetical protein